MRKQTTKRRVVEETSDALHCDLCGAKISDDTWGGLMVECNYYTHGNDGPTFIERGPIEVCISCVEQRLGVGERYAGEPGFAERLEKLAALAREVEAKRGKP